jgi:hypothetical protein
MLSAAGSFCTVIPVLHDYSLCNLLGTAIPSYAGCNCSRMGHSEMFLWAVTMVMSTPHTTGIKEAASKYTKMWPECWQL